MGNAVNGPCTIDDVRTVNPHDRPVREKFGKDSTRLFVVGVIKSGNQHDAVRDKEISVARRQSLLFAPHGVTKRRRHRNFDDPQWLSILIGVFLQHFVVLVQDRMVFVATVRLKCANDGGRIDKSSEVVDVPVGIVARKTAFQPDHVPDAEKIAEILLQVVL